MADINKVIAIIFQGEDKTSGIADKLDANLKSVGDSAGGATGKMGDLAKSTESLGKSEGSVFSLVNAMKALAASVVVKEFIDANVEMEKFDRAMTLLKGSSEAAGQEFVYISGVANTLGLNLFEAADAYVQLTAATKGTALEGDATREIFEAVSKAMASLGKSSDDTQGALLAISQIVSKGTVSMEELRGQLGERLPGAFQIAAKSMGLTTQELDNLVSSGKLTAEDFLPKFAGALRDTFGDTTHVDGFAASMARMQNAVSEAFIQIGNTGLFDAITKGVEVATAAVTGAVAGIKLLGDVIGIIFAAISTGNFTDVGAAMQEAMDRAGDSTRGARDAMLGFTDETTKAGAATKEAAIPAELTDAEKSAAALEQQTKDLNSQLKVLGIDPAKMKEPIEEIARAFEALASNPAVRGDQILAGLTSALKSATTYDDITKLGGALTQAFVNGRLSADEFSTGVLKLADQQNKVGDAIERTTGTSKAQAEELKKTQEATDKAREAAERFTLEMEKLASNERIKAMEFKVNLDIARLQEDTKRIQAAFESLNNTINSTGDVIGTTLGLFAQVDNFDFQKVQVLKDQLDIENKIRKESFELQKKLIEAQVNNLDAQTRALLKGDALIKIDGAGLQPHLEAFMWEILKAIQVRVNQQGLPLLFGMA